MEVQEWQDFKEFGQRGHKPIQGPVPGRNQGVHGKNMSPVCFPDFPRSRGLLLSYTSLRLL